jgi:hypothetical protein
MGMFSRWLDRAAQRHFAKDQSGRMIFLPRGRRHSCYYVDVADESRIKPLVKMYAIASPLINFIGAMASIGFTEALTFDHDYAQPKKLKLVLIVYLICMALFSTGPALILWRAYTDVATGLCASLTVVDPASLRFVKMDTGRVWMVLVLLGGAMVLLALGLLFLMPRPHH